jgi:cell division protein FtsZ
MFFKRRKDPPRNQGLGSEGGPNRIKITVVGVGGGGGNAILRMADDGLQGVRLLALNTDVQALTMFDGVPTFALGPSTTEGMGSGGKPEVGRKAIKESQEQVRSLLSHADMVFVTAAMGGGTGSGAASVVADLAKKQGALTVGIATLPFSFEGPRRRSVAEAGIDQLRSKVDTLITIENDRLLKSLGGEVTLDSAFRLADKVLRQGVQGISDIISIPGLINVDFADVKAVLAGGGPAFMAVGEGRGTLGAVEAAKNAVSDPLLGAPLRGATGILFNVRGGMDLTLGQVHRVAELVEAASGPEANVIFGVVQEKGMKGRVSVTLVATGVETESDDGLVSADEPARAAASGASRGPLAALVPSNGYSHAAITETRPMF